MKPRTRREFLADVGRGTLAASVGWSAADALGFLPRAAAEEAAAASISFGDLEPLVGFLQETPVDKLLPALVEKLRSGADLRQLTAAAALANARAFGGEDYIGYHTLMALAPAYRMAADSPVARRALPVLKVLYRNTHRLHESGVSETLRPVAPAPLPAGRRGGEVVREAVRRKDRDAAERAFAAVAGAGNADETLEELLLTVADATEVHRVVLPYRAWDLLGIIGAENAHTLLRQSVRYCLQSEARGLPEPYTAPRELLPRLLEEQKLLGRAAGTRAASDEDVERLSRELFAASPADAAGIIAAALAGGLAPESAGEAISLATNQLVLRDNGRREREVQPGKPLGSIHGDSIGVHACDSANAWRNMARAGSSRNAFSCLILGAYQAALDRVNRGGDFATWEPYPRAEHLEALAAAAPDALLRAAEAAIRDNDQARAAAAVHRYGESGAPHRAVFDLLLRYATSEDGALHAEKFYATASEEFAATRARFRFRQLVALSRVTASAYGKPAPGQDEAARLLGVSEA